MREATRIRGETKSGAAAESGAEAEAATESEGEAEAEADVEAEVEAEVESEAFEPAPGSRGCVALIWRPIRICGATRLGEWGPWTTPLWDAAVLAAG